MQEQTKHICSMQWFDTALPFYQMKERKTYHIYISMNNQFKIC